MLTEQITKLFMNTEKRKQLEEDAYKTFCSEFSYVAFVEKIVGYYLQL